MNRPARPRVVYDCMVFLQSAGRGAGPSFACLQLVERDLVQLYVSPEILAEVRDVLTRPEISRYFPLLTPDRINEFHQRIVDISISIDPVLQRYSLARDPKDEPYINLAIAAGAEYLVSRDKDLLDLMKPSIPESIAFREQYPDIAVIDPVALLQIVAEKRNNPEPEETEPAARPVDT